MATLAHVASFLVFLTGWGILFGLPVLAVRLFRRGRISRRILPAASAVACATGVSYALYRVEWFDVWRHGVPPLTYLAGYAPYVLVAGLVGWCVGSLIMPRRTLAQP
ncbi:MAG TPA: hypothetical protein VMF13_19355 [Luteitalea sp.]|nr:hypothetical protein [Luteitalea sp.]